MNGGFTDEPEPWQGHASSSSAAKPAGQAEAALNGENGKSWNDCMLSDSRSDLQPACSRLPW